MLSDQTDPEVYEALRSGNLLALGILYERYGEVVYRVALKMLVHPQEAEDLTQEIFIALSRGSAYDSKRGSMLAFLMTLTRSRAIDRLRQRLAQGRLLEHLARNYSASSFTNLMDKASLREISQRVRLAIEQLSYNERQVLEMTYYDGLSQSEISDQLKMPLGTVKTHKRKALLKLREILQDLID